MHLQFDCLALSNFFLNYTFLLNARNKEMCVLLSWSQLCSAENDTSTSFINPGFWKLLQLINPGFWKQWVFCLFVS